MLLELWLLRLWRRSCGGVARVGEAQASQLLQLEGQRDVVCGAGAAGAQGSSRVLPPR